MTSTTAYAISQVSRDSWHVELRGTVQTVFPVRACAEAVPDSETQDVSWGVGSDGPVDGAEKMFQVALRDLSAGPGGMHLINLYFYDNWADEHSSRLSQGDEIAVSGPGSRLVRPDPSAGAGDHPFCITFYDDEGDGFDRADGVLGDAGGEVTVTVVKGVDSSSRGGAPGGRRGGGRAARGRGRGRGRGQATQSGVKPGKAPYVYSSLACLPDCEVRCNVYGVVCSFGHRRLCGGRDLTTTLNLLDESCPLSDKAVSCNFFMPTRDALPAPVMVGDILRVHRAKVQEYKSRKQLLGVQGACSWMIVRKKQAVREVFQKVPAGMGATANTVRGGHEDADDLEPEEDSQQSGPDAGGGEVDSVLPGGEWEVVASSPNYTMEQVDQERCRALTSWFAAQAPFLWLKPSADTKTWVLDIFGRPQGPGSEVVEQVLDLVCCLVSKHETQGGGAGSLGKVYVADGTGFEEFTCSAPKGRHDAAFLKGMRFALGKKDWSPPVARKGSSSSSLPVVAYLSVDVQVHRKEWEALALSPGMWIRLRRLTITKNRVSGQMSATMKEVGSSVNPLHPRMAEVQAVAENFVRRCAAHAGQPYGAPTPPPPYAAYSSSADDAQVGAVATQPPNNNSGNDSGNHRVKVVVDANAERRHTPLALSPARRSLAAAEQSRGGGGGGGGGDTEKAHGSGRPENGRRHGGASSPLADQHNQSPPDAGRGGARQVAGAESNFGGLVVGCESLSPGSSGREQLNGTHSSRRSGMGAVEVARGEKRPLPSLPRAGGADAGVAKESRRFTNLFAVRVTPAPQTFDVRVRVVGHSPLKVEDFVQQGPAPTGGPMYLFSLRLEDDHGALDAIGAGPNAGLLFPGRPTPEQFASREDARQMVAQELADLEGRSEPDSDGGRRGLRRMVELRIRSYVTVVPPVRRGESPTPVKRYSIVAPSSF